MSSTTKIYEEKMNNCVAHLDRELTEDDQKNLEEEVQKLTDKFVKEIDATCARKTQEIMEV